MAEPKHPPAATLDAYASGALPEADSREVAAHLDTCASCGAHVSRGAAVARTVISGPRTEPVDHTHLSSSRPSEVSGPLPVGAQVGRYVVVALLGRGAMGVVYAAFDPRLDRKVALKLLRADVPQLESAALRDRLVREAQALAQLRHPNVLGIHDVGDYGEQLFIAMEHVEGQTVTAWLQAAPRSTREILEVFRQAGEGLAAAHRAGLVHRDFKPDNVLVAADGAVRVADFGLARRVASDEITAPGAPKGALEATQGLIGTPVYMAPQQLEGKPASPRSDQFSFCVALWEALCGERPFAGETVGDLYAATSRGQLRPIPPSRKLPRRVRAALLRGLSAAPEARFPDMDALLAQLGRPAPRALRPALVGLALVLAVVLGGVAAQRFTQARREARCAPGPASSALWNAQLAEPLAQRFATSKLPYAAESWSTARAQLDGWAQSWGARYAQVCLAVARERGDADPALHGQLACLDRQAANFRALRDDLAHADDDTIRRVLDVVDLLPTGDDCRLVGEFAEPVDPTQRERFRAVRDQVERAALSFEEVHLKDAAAAARVAADAAHQANLPALESQALEILGRTHAKQNQAKEARAELESSLRLAEASRRDSVVALDRMDLLDLAVLTETDVARAEAMLPDVRAAIDRIGASPAWEAEYQNSLAHLDLLKGDSAGAATALTRALEYIKQAHGEGTQLYANNLHDLAVAYNRLGNYDVAREKLEESIAIQRKLSGAKHPNMARGFNLRAALLEKEHKHAEAMVAIKEALAIYEANGMTETEEYTISLNNLGMLEVRSGHPEGAEKIRKAIELSEKLNEPLESRAEYMGALAEVLQDQGKLADALDLASRTIALKEKLYGKDSPRLGMTLAIRGGILNELHREPEAVVDMRRSLSLMNETNSSPVGREVARYELGRALYGSGQRKEGRDTVREVRDFFVTQGPAFADNAKEAGDWLAKHP